MPAENGTGSETAGETTALLTGDARVGEWAGEGRDGKRVGYGSADGMAGDKSPEERSVSLGEGELDGDGDADVDVENGGAGDDAGGKNRLFEGNKENMQRMGLLFPAVALGVSSPISLLV